MRSLTISRWPCQEATCNAVRPSLSGMFTLMFECSSRYFTIFVLFSSAKMYNVVRESASFRFTSQPYFSNVLILSTWPESRFRVEMYKHIWESSAVSYLQYKPNETKSCRHVHVNLRNHYEWTEGRR